MDSAISLLEDERDLNIDAYCFASEAGNHTKAQEHTNRANEMDEAVRALRAYTRRKNVSANPSVLVKVMP